MDEEAKRELQGRTFGELADEILLLRKQKEQYANENARFRLYFNHVKDSIVECEMGIAVIPPPTPEAETEEAEVETETEKPTRRTLTPLAEVQRVALEILREANGASLPATKFRTSLLEKVQLNSHHGLPHYLRELIATGLILQEGMAPRTTYRLNNGNSSPSETLDNGPKEGVIFSST